MEAGPFFMFCGKFCGNADALAGSGRVLVQARRMHR